MGAPDGTEGLTVTDRTRLRRHAREGSHERGDLYAVLDAGFVCHLGLQTPDGPMVLPTSYGRDRDRLYLHGSVASRSLRSALDRVPMCVTVTHIDGVVLARSVYEHALNYRSAIIYGTPEVLTEPADKRAGMHTIADQIAPGQWGYAREPSDEELAVTTVLVLPLDEASVKVRTGPPRDGDGPDADRPVWAGEIPLRTVRLEPRPDPTLRGDVPLPPHLAGPGVARGVPPQAPAD
jgi:nitroimidazol reductase NimA-like FMN-containing flavoprotein (pyridoxamine 5'-phosphate oxidase superfamily)